MLYFLFLSQFFLISCALFGQDAQKVGRPVKFNSSLKTIFATNKVYTERNISKVLLSNDLDAKQKARSDLREYNAIKKQFAQEYVKYYSDNNIISESMLTQDTAPLNRNREIFFYVDESRKVKPKRNSEMVAVAKKENFLPVSENLYGYFSEVKNITSPEASEAGQDKKIDYNMIYSMNSLQLSRFYNVN